MTELDLPRVPATEDTLVGNYKTFENGEKVSVLKIHEASATTTLADYAGRVSDAHVFKFTLPEEDFADEMPVMAAVGEPIARDGHRIAELVLLASGESVASHSTANPLLEGSARFGDVFGQLAPDADELQVSPGHSNLLPAELQSLGFIASPRNPEVMVRTLHHAAAA